MRSLVHVSRQLPLMNADSQPDLIEGCCFVCKSKHSANESPLTLQLYVSAVDNLSPTCVVDLGGRLAIKLIAEMAANISFFTMLD